jgi:hypothetical protein
MAGGVTLVKEAEWEKGRDGRKPAHLLHFYGWVLHNG